MRSTFLNELQKLFNPLYHSSLLSYQFCVWFLRSPLHPSWSLLTSSLNCKCVSLLLSHISWFRSIRHRWHHHIFIQLPHHTQTHTPDIAHLLQCTKSFQVFYSYKKLSLWTRFSYSSTNLYFKLTSYCVNKNQGFLYMERDLAGRRPSGKKT